MQNLRVVIILTIPPLRPNLGDKGIRGFMRGSGFTFHWAGIKCLPIRRKRERERLLSCRRYNECVIKQLDYSSLYSSLLAPSIQPYSFLG